jgi:hypothetical protein
MARGGHGLPRVSLEPTRPYPSTLCGRDTPETALHPFHGYAYVYLPLISFSLLDLNPVLKSVILGFGDFQVRLRVSTASRLHPPRGEFHDQADNV